MNKKYMTFAFLFLAIGLVSAGYLVNSFAVKVDIAEPFEVSYAILGDAGNPSWESATDCNEIDTTTFVDLSQGTQPVDFSYIYAGENRELCVKIVNSAEVPLGYIVSGTVRAGEGNFENCSIAFNNLTALEADVGAGVTTIASKPIHINAESPIVTDCVLDISVSRTETFA